MNYSRSQLFFLTATRMAIGWHLLYEGFIKYTSDGWTAKGYLMSAKGWFAGIFQAMGESETMLAVADFLNIYGQLAVGLGLILGLFARYAQLAGIVMIGLFYLAHPPFGGESTGTGNYLVVDRNLIEALTLCVLLLFPTSAYTGLDRLLKK